MLSTIKKFITTLDNNIRSNLAMILRKIPGAIYDYKNRPQYVSMSAIPYMNCPKLFNNPKECLFPQNQLINEMAICYKDTLNSGSIGKISSLCKITQNSNSNFGGASRGDNTELWMKSTEFEDYLGHFLSYNP